MGVPGPTKCEVEIYNLIDKFLRINGDPKTTLGGSRGRSPQVVAGGWAVPAPSNLKSTESEVCPLYIYMYVNIIHIYIAYVCPICGGRGTLGHPSC